MSTCGIFHKVICCRLAKVEVVMFSKRKTNTAIFSERCLCILDKPTLTRWKKNAFKMFVDTFSADKTSFDKFVSFITKWSVQEGNKLKLDKSWMQDVIALSLVSPFVKPLSFSIWFY
ncbi:hypothetical protein Zmor_017050 [Zophobas morio]|uniref:Uncharacterized protein n=1 Tax=Zophobas morio TaxID=2755281 RepID=A0AA38I8G2_9CUCU|nr:hypothetical protein Zmor_017050 [Zophobas morio]